MIGVIKDEDRIILEFNPIFAAKRYRWQRVVIPCKCRYFGEYGISISFSGIKPTFWINWENSCFPSLWGFIKYVFRTKRQRK